MIEYLSERDGRAFLGESAIPWMHCEYARDEETAVRVADGIGFPVVLKGCAKDVLHRHKTGGIHLDIRSAAEVRTAAAEIRRRYSANGHACTGFLVQAQARPGDDLFMAVTRDASFGLCLVLAPGGTQVEETTERRVIHGTEMSDTRLRSELACVLGGELTNEQYLQLAEIAHLLLRLGEDDPQICSVELNPVRIMYFPRPSVVALDVLVSRDPSLREARSAVSEPSVHHRSAVAAALNAKRIGIVGVSRQPRGSGYKLLRHLKLGGYDGDLVIVHPDAAVVHGLRAYPDLDVGELDILFVAVAPERLGAILEDVARRPVAAVVVVTPDHGVPVPADVSVLGPNTAGILSAPARLRGLFQGSATLPLPTNGNLAFITQSGSIASYLLARSSEERAPLRYLIPTGNESSIRMDHALAALAQDDEVSVIGLFIEGVRAGAEFIVALEAALSAGKHVVAYPVGRTSAGQQAARSHTDAVAGSYEILAATLRQRGGSVVGELDDFFEQCKWHALSAQRSYRSADNFSLGAYIVTSSGASATILADEFGDAGVEMPQFSDGLVAELEATLPPGTPIRNPLDVGGDVVNNPDLITEVVRLLTRRRESPGLVVALGTQAGESGIAVAASLTELWRSGEAPMVISRLGADSLTPEVIDTYRCGGVPVFRTPSRLVRAVASR